MKTSHHLAIISLITLVLFACQNNTETKTAVEEASKTETIKEQPKEVIVQKDTTSEEEIKANEENSSPNETEEVTSLEETEIEEVSSTTPTNDPTLDRFRAGVSDDRMSLILESIAINLQNDKLKYDRTIGQDCSGIFHRIKDSLQVRLPVFKGFQFPQFNTDRNTRQIAHWYHTNGNLHIVQNAKADQNKIRPGSVLFFGRSDEQYNNLNIELLSNPGVWQHDKTAGKGKIYHIAVVTAVKTDKEGKQRVTIMHGRNSKYIASRTEVNYDGPGGYKKAFAKFPFGNWNQQLVAIANIATPK